MMVEPLYMQYPMYENLNSIQKNTYLNIKHEIDNFRYIDVGNNESYIMLYLNELMQKLLISNYSYDFFTDRIKFIKHNYLAGFLQDYCSIWLGDVYYYFNIFDKALSSWVDGLRPEKIWTLLSSKIISLKLREDIHISAKEALSYKKNITKYGSNNLELVIQYVENIINRDYVNGTISTKYFLETKNKYDINPCLFTGCVFGYFLNEKYISRKDHRNEVHIESLGNLVSYIGDVSRRAENAIREDLDMPKIGEGWISETELYYKIKMAFSKFSVIQHYNSEWLGKQHLDVYIKEMNIGIEYHGVQHFEPVEYFGGQEAFIENQKRDKRKAAKCKKNGTKLIVAKDGYNFDEIVEEIRNLTHASTL